MVAELRLRDPRLVLTWKVIWSVVDAAGYCVPPPEVVDWAFRTAEEAPIADLTDAVLASCSAAGPRAEQERLLWSHFYPIVYAAMGRWALEDEAHLRDRLLQLPWTRLLEAMRNRNLVAPLLLEAGVPFEHIYRSWRPAVPLTPASGDSDASSGGPVGGQAGPSDELAVQHAGETPGAERGQSAEQPEGQRPQQELEDRLRRMARRA